MAGKQTRRQALQIGNLFVVAALTGIAGCLGGESTPENDSEETETTDESDGDESESENESDGDPVSDDESHRDEESKDSHVETVEVGDTYFEPGSLRVESGTAIEWVWTGQATHNVAPVRQPDDADWEGHPQLENEGFDYRHVFDVAGTYVYTCEQHPGMDGTIVVDD